jgi:hypothetical protein
MYSSSLLCVLHARPYYPLWFVRHGMARPRIADGGDGLLICKVAANTLNKQSRTADKEWSSSLGIGREANNSSP